VCFQFDMLIISYKEPLKGGGGVENNVFETLWKTRVTLKAQVLGWRLLLDKLPTKAKLIVKGIPLQHSLCEFCIECEETTKHLFFSCSISQKVWNMC